MEKKDITTGGKYIANTLKEYGVTHIFFLEAVLRDAMVEMERLGIKRVLTHSEKTAAYMACGYGRMSGRPGVCLAQSVGAFNLASGIQEAYLASAPVIAISGKKKPLFQNRHCYQEVSHDFFKTVTKYQGDVVDSTQLPNVLRQAFREATSAVPGPVHIDVSDHMGRVIDYQPINTEVVVEERFRQVSGFRPEPDKIDVEKSVKAIKQAERPVILLGGGAVISDAREEVTQFVEKLQIPVVSSVDGKNAILGTHKNNIGCCGTYSRWCANRALNEADLIIVIGCSMADLVTHDWALIAPGTKIIQIDISQSMLGLNYPNDVSILGDAKITLQHLLHAVHSPHSNREWLKTTQNYLAEWREERAAEISSDEIPINPARLCQEISRLLPDNGVLVSDTGNSAIWTSTIFELTKPGQTFMRAQGGALGWALPGAMGVKCAVPDRPVVCFTGDGGFLYHISELETAARCGINTVTVINNNRGFGQCKPNILDIYGDRPGKPEEFYKFGPTDYAQMAEEMGCLGIRVERPEEIKPALEKAFKAERPVLIDVITDIDCVTPPVWTP